MKAEALAEIGGAADLEEAVDLVSYTYDRAHPDLEEGSLKGKYTNQSEVRNLVFDERQREFLLKGNAISTLYAVCAGKVLPRIS